MLSECGILFKKNKNKKKAAHEKRPKLLDDRTPNFVQSRSKRKETEPKRKTRDRNQELKTIIKVINARDLLECRM
jgi:hypothetical protein